MNINLFPYEVYDVEPLNDVPWNIKMTNVPIFWEISQTRGGERVVAVVDTGIDVNHPEFAGKIIEYKNFTYDDNTDRDGHGSHVAGTIAGKTVGMAPDSRIIALKVFGSANGFQFQDALRYILDYNKQVYEKDKIIAVNCSWGGPYDPVLHYLIRQLIESGVAVIVAAGNQGDGKPDTQEIFNWPGFLWEVITTGALNQDGTVAVYSSSYDGIDIAAPGTDVYSAWPGGGYKLLRGTSMATPHVTGAYVLLYDIFVKRFKRIPTVEEMEKVLFKHVKKVNIEPEFVGHGILDMTWDTKKWPLYRVQCGAFYIKENCDLLNNKLRDAGFNTYVVHY